jgi:hypothetical protein
MYAGLSAADKDTFSRTLERYVGANRGKGLFKRPYSLFYGQNLAKRKDIIETITGLKIEDFIASIIEPGRFRDFTQGLSERFRGILEEVRASAGIHPTVAAVIDEELENLRRGLFNFKGTDLVSPPPFLRHTYSMGKYESPRPEVAVLEMRGYSVKCETPLRMDETIESWLREEVTAAVAEWNPSASIKRMLKDNIGGSFSVICKAQDPREPIDLEQMKRELQAVTARTYDRRIVGLIESIGATTAEELARLRAGYIELLRWLDRER